MGEFVGFLNNLYVEYFLVLFGLFLTFFITKESVKIIEHFKDKRKRV